MAIQAENIIPGLIRFLTQSQSGGFNPFVRNANASPMGPALPPGYSSAGFTMPGSAGARNPFAKLDNAKPLFPATPKVPNFVANPTPTTPAPQPIGNPFARLAPSPVPSTAPASPIPASPPAPLPTPTVPDEYRMQSLPAPRPDQIAKAKLIFDANARHNHPIMPEVALMMAGGSPEQARAVVNPFAAGELLNEANANRVTGAGNFMNAQTNLTDSQNRRDVGMRTAQANENVARTMAGAQTNAARYGFYGNIAGAAGNALGQGFRAIGDYFGTQSPFQLKEMELAAQQNAGRQAILGQELARLTEKVEGSNQYTGQEMTNLNAMRAQLGLPPQFGTPQAAISPQLLNSPLTVSKDAKGNVVADPRKTGVMQVGNEWSDWGYWNNRPTVKLSDLEYVGKGFDNNDIYKHKNESRYFYTRDDGTGSGSMGLYNLNGRLLPYEERDRIHNKNKRPPWVVVPPPPPTPAS